MKKQRAKSPSNEAKIEAVARYLPLKGVRNEAQKAADAMGVSATAFHAWVKRFGKAAAKQRASWEENGATASSNGIHTAPVEAPPPSSRVLAPGALTITVAGLEEHIEAVVAKAVREQMRKAWE